MDDELDLSCLSRDERLAVQYNRNLRLAERYGASIPVPPFADGENEVPSQVGEYETPRAVAGQLGERSRKGNAPANGHRGVLNYRKLSLTG